MFAVAAESIMVLLRVRVLSTRHFSITNNNNKWHTLPPFSPTPTSLSPSASASTTALKWVLRCCPHLPKPLVHKLFRLRQVRRSSSPTIIKRVAAKDTLNSGDTIFLPLSVKHIPTEVKRHSDLTPHQIQFVRSLVLYKDPAVLVLNKPPGMPVQGGTNIKRSLDVLAAACLNFEYPDSPRLVHRLDRDCSGILVMGRTQTSATILHSIFREKTSTASDDIDAENRILQRRYIALVIGCPRRPRGLITASLGKVVVDNGKSDRITIVDNSTLLSSQHAITEYHVIGSSSHGYTWLELYPLTGRKHQLRVHCAEVLGTPIVGDYKYGWQAHRKFGHDNLSDVDSSEELCKEEMLPFGLTLNKGSISERCPRLHLHCKQIVLPNIYRALQDVQSPHYDLNQVGNLALTAPLPPYMQRSWDITNS
ncbi:RNA pseudouridine synthase 4, mitochondrial isoform X1 [Arachis stenosperma]|uniref:RNA pseudouridine synthase 4, mitochondrial isoform X1 n=1 Tax=Arachis stenosperma TaxID=217475 RepID=UPI0025AD5052|nr:RNA pseudouridine synthase 4, mitochondrial isoform X1 [Arachis stenosperma]